MWKPNRHNGKVAQWRGNSIKVDKMKICYIWAGERGPFDLRYGHQKGERPRRGTSQLGVSIKNLFLYIFFTHFTKIYMRKWNLLQYHKGTTSAKSSQGWGVSDRWHEVPAFKRLPLGTELAVVVCHSSGENPAMSAIWKEKKKNRKCCMSQNL